LRNGLSDGRIRAGVTRARIPAGELERGNEMKLPESEQIQPQSVEGAHLILGEHG
jgi:hypothetical protein